MQKKPTMLTAGAQGNSKKLVKTNNNDKKAEKIPPINVFGQRGADMVRLLATEKKITNLQLKRVNSEKISIRTNNLADFRSAKEALSTVEVPHFTYTPRTEKNQTFLLKGLDCDENTDDLLSALKEIAPTIEFLSLKILHQRDHPSME